MARKTVQRNGSPLYWSAETWALISLRLFLSLRFLLAALGKFSQEGSYSFSHYYNGFVPWITNEFAQKTNLPGFLVTPYAYLLGYVEFILGAALFLGIKTKYALALIALLLVSLAYGQMLLGEGGAISEIGIHLLITVAALYFVRHNKFEALR